MWERREGSKYQPPQPLARARWVRVPCPRLCGATHLLREMDEWGVTRHCVRCGWRD